MKITDFNSRKKQHEKISMVTCYDYTSARILAQTQVDCLLVGDSVAMTMHGFKDTIPATIEMISAHTEAVVRGAGDKLIISDLPFLSYRRSLAKNITAVQALMRAGAQGVKLEGAAGNLKLIRHLTESGIPVMGHLGLTLQHMHMLGGFKIQGKTYAAAKKIIKDALSLQEAGCFALVLECIPSQLAKEITELLAIPTIGIGAGADTDGQVLVWQDLLGLNLDFQPKFVRKFLNGAEQITNGIKDFVNAVKLGDFPQYEHCYDN